MATHVLIDTRLTPRPNSTTHRDVTARDAAGAMVAWLREQGVATVVAHVHPDHRASQGVARAVGLTPTVITVDGEVRWQG